jgi:hypothetical protein
LRHLLLKPKCFCSIFPNWSINPGVIGSLHTISEETKKKLSFLFYRN